MDAKILRRWCVPARIVATIISGIHTAIRIDESKVIIVHLHASFWELEKLAELKDLLAARLVDAAVDTD